MAKSPPASSPKQQPPKLPRLSKNQKIQKRPLLHPAIPSPHASSNAPKTIYVSASSPFLSVVKRVKKYLAAIETRAAGPIDLRHPSRNVVQQVRDGVRSAARHEEILLKGTGRAVEKVLRLAVWFQGEEGRDEGVNVVVRTSSVGAVDDVVVKKGEEEEEVEEDETRIRRVSCLEVGISLR